MTGIELWMRKRKLNDKMLLIFMNTYKIYQHREYKYGIEIKNI